MDRATVDDPKRHVGQRVLGLDALTELGQVRWGSVFMDLTVLPRQLKLRKEHGFVVCERIRTNTQTGTMLGTSDRWKSWA
jgi:hypothetical protein